MMYASPIASLGHEFDDFLFAPVSHARNGMLLSVLSALARLDVDPWHEAAKLARLPRAAATERLMSLIAALPEDDAPSAHRNLRTTVVRLIALLPHEIKANISPIKPILSDDSGYSNPASYMILLVFVTAFLIFGYLLRARPQPPAQIDSAHASSLTTASPPMPPASDAR